MMDCADKQALMYHRGVRELRALRRSRHTPIEKCFYKPVRLRGEAVCLSGGPRRRFGFCSCPFLTGLYDHGSQLLRRVNVTCDERQGQPPNPEFVCVGCLAAPTGVRLAARFAERLADADAERLHRLAAAEAAHCSVRAGGDADSELPITGPLFCFVQDIPDVDCACKPGFVYRAQMRRLRECRDQQLGIFQEEPIKRDCHVINGRQCYEVALQTLTQADGRLWPGRGRSLQPTKKRKCSKACSKSCTKHDKPAKDCNKPAKDCNKPAKACAKPAKACAKLAKSRSQSPLCYTTMRSSMLRVQNKMSDIFESPLKERMDINSDTESHSEASAHHQRQYTEPPPTPATKKQAEEYAVTCDPTVRTDGSPRPRHRRRHHDKTNEMSPKQHRQDDGKQTKYSPFKTRFSFLKRFKPGAMFSRH